MFRSCGLLTLLYRYHLKRLKVQINVQLFSSSANQERSSQEPTTTTTTTTTTAATAITTVALFFLGFIFFKKRRIVHNSIEYKMKRPRFVSYAAKNEGKEVRSFS
uniref:Uncharacterized protein n=1 Tax=Glossina morsitans morsitans TaxID=37546 RepID=A0A1B0G2M1_GLOMM